MLLPWIEHSDYNRANFSELRKALSQADLIHFFTDNIDNCWDQWKVLFSSIVTNYVPTKCVKGTNSPPCIDAEVRHLMRKKYTALRNNRKNRTAERKSRLRTLCQQIKYAIRNKHKSYLAKIEASFKQNPKLFWSYHKAILHHRSVLNSIICHNDRIAKTSREKAELFNSYLALSSNQQDRFSLCHLLRYCCLLICYVIYITISEEEVAHHLSKLNPTKSSGPDGVPGRILIECSSVIAPKLCALFNHSLQSGIVPSEWKCANVTPIYKKGKKEFATNCRPISLLPIISKVLERCVCNRLYGHIRHMVHQNQHSFLHGRSCTTQLLSTLHDIGQLLDNNIQTDVLFLDFAKAFDSVDHAILLQKLQGYGVSGNLYN